jgi:hypothetical protein
MMGVYSQLTSVYLCVYPHSAGLGLERVRLLAAAALKCRNVRAFTPSLSLFLSLSPSLCLEPPAAHIGDYIWGGVVRDLVKATRA